jgi:glycosyltransferase involved in cell wall biosynthesis
LTEIILACDPDIVVLSEIRWGRQFARVLRETFPDPICLTEAGQIFDLPCVRRPYDPSVKVSIVLPTYNGSKYIRQSIESCVNQTHANLELLIVDDASSDDIARIVKEYPDPRIRYFRHVTNRGIAEGLNTGFQNATGDYLTWTSDDNYYTENAIEEMLRFLQAYPQLDFVYAENYVVDEGNTTWRGGTVRRNEPAEALVIDNFVGACFLYTRKVYETIGRYNPKTFLAEDYDYWVRVSKQFRMQRLFRRLYYYRFHQNSLTSKFTVEEVKDKVKLVKEINSMP